MLSPFTCHGLGPSLHYFNQVPDILHTVRAARRTQASSYLLSLILCQPIRTTLDKPILVFPPDFKQVEVFQLVQLYTYMYRPTLDPGYGNEPDYRPSADMYM